MYKYNGIDISKATFDASIKQKDGKFGVMDKMVAIFDTIVSSGQNGCCFF